MLTVLGAASWHLLLATPSIWLLEPGTGAGCQAARRRGPLWAGIARQSFVTLETACQIRRVCSSKYSIFVQNLL